MMKENILLVVFFILSMPLFCFGQQQEDLNSVNAIYEHVFVEGERSDWNLAQLWYKRDFTNLTSIFRIRYADRFDQNSVLSEVDLYPTFSEKTYAHFNVGASLPQKGLFPNFKTSSTFFHNLSSTLVGGLGIEYQSFDIDDVVIYNANLNWYVNDFLFLGEGLLQVRDKTPLATIILTGRKYLHRPSYLFVKVAYGQAPQNLRFEEDVLNSFESFFISVGSDIKAFENFFIYSALDFRNSNFSMNTSRYRVGVSAGFSYRF